MSELTTDEALLWLNERVGKSVHVSVQLELGDYLRTLFAAEGELRHWSARASGGALSVPRDDLAGLYDVGGASLDLSDLPEAFLLPDGGEGRVAIRVDDELGTLAVDLAEYVTLEIVEQSEFAAGV